ncbi:MAG: preprotein translocase subunit SecE [Armatimonadota bacterium]
MGTSNNVTKQTTHTKPSGRSKSAAELMAGFKKFFKDVKTELKRCEWPTKDQTIRSTIIVIGFILVISAFIGIIDVTLSAITAKMGLFKGGT